MKNAILATGKKAVAERLLDFTRKYMKQYKIGFSESVELAMRNSEIWKEYEHLI